MKRSVLCKWLFEGGDLRREGDPGKVTTSTIAIPEDLILVPLSVTHGLTWRRFPFIVNMPIKDCSLL